MNYTRAIQYLSSPTKPKEGPEWFARPQYLYPFANSTPNLQTLELDQLKPYLTVGLEVLSRRHNVDREFDEQDRRSSAWDACSRDARLLEEFKAWERWEGEIPDLPGENDRSNYEEKVVWPGPPEPTGPLHNFTRARERRRYHRAFYKERTGHYLTRQEARLVTGLADEERRLFGMPDSPEAAGSDSSPAEGTSYVKPRDPNMLPWPPGSPVWSLIRAPKPNTTTEPIGNSLQDVHPPQSVSRGRNPWNTPRRGRQCSPTRYATNPYPSCNQSGSQPPE